MEQTKSREQYNLPVEGMTCASCVSRVEKTLNKLSGVENAVVNFATEKASFIIDPQKIRIKEIEKAIEDVGYKLVLDVNEGSTTLDHNNLKDNVSDYEKNLYKNLIISTILTIPVFIIGMFYEFNWFRELIPLSKDHTFKILFLLTTIIVFVPGKHFYKSFWENLKNFTADMNSLVAIGTGSAYIYSMIAVLFPEFFNAAGIAPHVYFDTTVVIITLILFGKWLESKTKLKAGEEIKKLLMLKPKTALVKKEEKFYSVNIDELNKGFIVAVKPGEIVPADGIIIFGSSEIDESMITGESNLVYKKEGEKVVGGSINKTGYFEFEVISIGQDSVLGKIILLVEKAQASKAPIQRLTDTISSVFVPIVIFIAIITFLVWLIIGGDEAFNLALVNFVAVLVIACPCALGLATPTAVLAGAGIGALHGILIKDGASLEKIRDIDIIMLDKTGTITKGKPIVTDIISYRISERELIKLSASIEKNSEHPVAKAVVDYANYENIEPESVQSFKNMPGIGVEAIYNGKKVSIGNEKLLNKYIKIDDKELINVENLKNEGKTILFIIEEAILLGIIAVRDEIKENSIKAVNLLKKSGKKIVMLTGDNKKTAEIIARESNIDEYEAELLPEGKVEVVEKYRRLGLKTAMVGDGINDAPALAKSDVAIAVSSGTDVAIEVSSVVLMRNDLLSLYDAIKLSERTLRTIKQNLFWAFIYNSVGIPLAALGMLNPMFAAMAMSFSSVSVLLNSLRLKRAKFLS